MKTRMVATAVVLVGLACLASSATGAAPSTRYSGTVSAIDPQGGVLILDEVGPWRVDRGSTVMTRRTIRLTPSTKYNVFIRVNAPDGFAGDFLEVALDVDDISLGDTVTAECVREGGKLVALTVTVADVP